MSNNSKNNLPSGWEWSNFGEICEKSQYGWTTKADHSNGTLKLLRTTDITSGEINWSSVPFCSEAPNDIEKYLVKSGDVLISRAGSVGVSFLINNPDYAVFASYLIRFRPKTVVDTKYFYYFLKSPDYWAAIGKSKAGIAVPNVNASKMSEVQIPLAPLNEQKRIVAEIEKQFSRLDEAVANLKRVKANLKRYKAAVLKAAVEGKLTEEWRKQHPDVEPADKLLERILVERRANWQGRGKYKDPDAPDTSDLPELPEGWVWVSLKSLSEALGGYAFKSKAFTDTGPQIVKMANIKMGKLDLNQRPSFMQNVPEDVLDRYRLIDGDILVTLTGTRKKRDYGYIVQIKNPETTLLLNQRIARLRPINDDLSSFLTLALQSEVYRNRFFEHETGNVGQGNVGMKAVTFEPVPLPPIEEQLEIISLYEGLNSVAGQIETTIDVGIKRADRLRQSILKNAFNGKLLHSEHNVSSHDAETIPT